MENQALFSSKNKSKKKKKKCRLLQFLFGALRVNEIEMPCLTDILPYWLLFNYSHAYYKIQHPMKAAFVWILCYVTP